MIHYFFENTDEFEIAEYITKGLENLIVSEGKKLGDIQYIFCDDEYLLKVNQDYLQHDYYTDIITFDYVQGKSINGDIFISLPRISDNAQLLSTNEEEEFKRVLIHGILHLCGYKDKTKEEQKLMRSKEDFYIKAMNSRL
ncbi:MAG: rRNA maturation RNase YbeY [Flavobacteriales bacterium]|nr:MAG: rRNA maturation RNase YbeY [Flavobacteriales bacterium]